jgi:hypothetical protein
MNRHRTKQFNVAEARTLVKFGTYKGKLVVPDDFDAPDQDIVDMFENSGPLFPEQKNQSQ